MLSFIIGLAYSDYYESLMMIFYFPHYFHICYLELFFKVCLYLFV